MPVNVRQVIEGMGELHLDIIVDRLKREFNVDCKVGAPQVRIPRGLCSIYRVEGSQLVVLGRTCDVMFLIKLHAVVADSVQVLPVHAVRFQLSVSSVTASLLPEP